MSMSKKFAVSLLVLFISGCATIPMKPVAGGDQKTIYQEGMPILVSAKTHIVFLGTPSGFDTNIRPYVYVAVLNPSDRPFLFSTENVTVWDGLESLKVYTHEELKRSYERRMAAAMFLLAFSAGMQAAAASQPSYTYGTVYGPRGYTATYYAQTYDPAAAIQAQNMAMANSLQMMSAIQNSRNPELAVINSILRKNTILPGAFVGGLVVFDPPAEVMNMGKKAVTIQVRIGDDRHEFKVEFGE